MRVVGIIEVDWLDDASSTNRSHAVWACPACTFENKEGSIVCHMCSLLREHSFYGTTVSGATPASWACATCTWSNEGVGNRCGMCYALRFHGSGDETPGDDSNLEEDDEDEELNGFEEFNGFDEGEQRACAICMDDFEQGDLRKNPPCLHGYHAACVDSWLKRNGLCPVCRHRINGTLGVQFCFDTSGVYLSRRTSAIERFLSFKFCSMAYNHPHLDAVPVLHSSKRLGLRSIAYSSSRLCTSTFANVCLGPFAMQR